MLLPFSFLTCRADCSVPKRLAADILGCGVRKVWISPDYLQQVCEADSRVAVRQLIASHMIVKKIQPSVSRFHARKHNQAKLLGRHTGPGKRRGTRESRCPSKTLWIRRQRVLRNLLQHYREDGKIDCHMYRRLYRLSKGNQFRNKAVLVEYIHKQRADEARRVESQKLAEQRRNRATELKEKRDQQRAQRYKRIAEGI